MQTRILTVGATGDVGQVVERLATDSKPYLDDKSARLGLVFASTSQSLGAVLAALAPRLPGVVLLGASTAGEFTEVGNSKGGVTFVLVTGDYKVSAGFGRGLHADPEAAVSEAIAALAPRDPAYAHRTAILLIDPLSGRSEEVTLIVGAAIGPDIPVVGGAAGDDLKMERTWVGLGAVAQSDAIVLCALDSKAPLGLGVAHGHRVLSRPLKVTSAKDNVVYTIDGRSAWEVWVEETRAASDVDPNSLSADQIGAFLLRFEAGLQTGEELKIRAPLERNPDGSLSFACGIPEGTTFQITRSEPAWQLASARLAAKRARTQLGKQEIAGALVFDCICRDLILGAEFASGVRAMSAELDGAPLGGFETYGEIALDQSDLSGFHNTTSVVLAFPR